MAEPLILHSLPLFMRLAGRPVILLGEGEAAMAKRRLLARAGAEIVDEGAAASLAIVAIEEDDLAQAAIERLRARGILVNAVDRPALCDFTLPAIIDRLPVIVAIGTGGASAGLAAALRQRLEAMLPASLGQLADGLSAARARLRTRFPDGGERRRQLAIALAPGGALDPLEPAGDVDTWLAAPVSAPVAADAREAISIRLASADPDELTLRQARQLAMADRVYHTADVPLVILDRARADADRIPAAIMPDIALPGLSIFVEMAR